MLIRDQVTVLRWVQAGALVPNPKNRRVLAAGAEDETDARSGNTDDGGRRLGGTKKLWFLPAGSPLPRVVYLGLRANFFTFIPGNVTLGVPLC